MLYKELLEKLEPEVNDAVAELFKKAALNQRNENDLLLVAIHGFYDYQHADSNLSKKLKLSPYVFGIGEEGLTNKAQHDFFDAFLRGYIVNGDRAKYLEYQKSEDPQLNNHLIINQLELSAYLKFWESDYIMKQLYNITTKLLHGISYDWHVRMKNKGKKKLLDIEVKDAIRSKTPKFFALYEKIYSRQIRNAAAHSQFYLNNSYLILTNYDPLDNHNLHRLTLDEWEVLFHYFVLFYRAFSIEMANHNNKCMEEAANKQFGKQIIITKLDGKERTEWLKCLPEIPRWIWYKSWQKQNTKTFSIV